MQPRQSSQQRQMHYIQPKRRRQWWLQREHRYRPGRSKAGQASAQQHPVASPDVPPRRSRTRSRKSAILIWTTDGIRSWLAICITVLVSIVALGAAYETSADGVLGKLLPLLTLILGYYFGKGTTRSG